MKDKQRTITVTCSTHGILYRVADTSLNADAVFLDLRHAHREVRKRQAQFLQLCYRVKLAGNSAPVNGS